jgi:anti-anti-sigma regulatory factor
LKIEKNSNGANTVIRLIGRFDMGHIEELTRQLQAGAVEMVVDLGEVTLVDLPIVRFLMVCKARGVRIENCPAYIRQWMIQEQSV